MFFKILARCAPCHVAMALALFLGSSQLLRADQITLANFDTNARNIVDIKFWNSQDASFHTLGAYATQFHFTSSSPNLLPNFNSWCVDLTHEVSYGQTYSVTPITPIPNSVSSAAVGLSYLYNTYGRFNFTGLYDLEAGFQVALWELLADGYPPAVNPIATHYGLDVGNFQLLASGTTDYALVVNIAEAYLQDAMNHQSYAGNATFLDASLSGNGPNRGQSALFGPPSGDNPPPAPPVPEPAAFVLLGLGAAGLAGYRRVRSGRQVA